MKIVEYRFMRPEEPFEDGLFKNWSRRYEWGYVLDFLRRRMYKPARPVVHNTCCGSNSLHALFQSEMLPMCERVENSDIFEPKESFENFRKYNVLEPCPEMYDLVLCISALEEIPEKGMNLPKAFLNLVGQVRRGGDLIITCDYPDVDTDVLDKLVGTPIKDVPVRLNGDNSSHRQPEFEHLNVVLLHLRTE